MKKVTLFYRGKLDTVFDKVIKKKLKKIGFVWWSQGYNFRRGIREIHFEYEDTNR